MSGTTEHRERSTFSSASYLASLMAELDRAAISARIRQARKQAGFRNRNDIADLLHVHPRTIEDWENPKHQNVPWDRLDEIAKTTGVTREWLLHGEREEEEDVLASLAVRLGELEALSSAGFEALEAAISQLAEQLRLPEQADGSP